METKLYRGGAPKKDECDRKEKIVRVLFNDSEHKRLIERKSLTKCNNLSTFVRMVCLDRPLHMKPQLSTHQDNVLSLLREMRSDVLRIGVNINQSSKRINSTTDYLDLQRDVNHMSEQLGQFDTRLRQLMSVVLSTDQAADLALVSTNGSQDQ